MMKSKEQYRLKLWLDRLLSKSLLQQLGILAVGLVVAFGVSFLLLSFSGAEWQAYCDDRKMNRLLLPLYLLIDSNAFSNLYLECAVHGWMLFASGITFLVGVFIFNGAIIGIITNSIEQRVSNHREGRLHYLKSGHYVIMGYDDMVPSIIMHIFEKDKDAYVLLLSAAEASHIRERLKRTLGERMQKRIIVNRGHRMSADYYKDIHLEASEEVYIVGQRSLPAHDAINVECVDSICRYLQQDTIQEYPTRIICVFEDLDTYAAFKTSEIFGRVKDLGIAFVPYNFYTGWARQVFVAGFHRDMDRPKERAAYPSVFGNGVGLDEERFVHLVFIGITNFSVAFAMEAAHVLHFPNFGNEKPRRTRITFIDVNADKEKDEFITRYRHFFEIQPYYYCDLSRGGNYADDDENRRKEYVYFSEGNGYTDNETNFLDVEFEFIKGDVFSQQVQAVITDWAKDTSGQFLSLFLAQSNQRRNFAFAMNMPDEVYDKEINIFIRQDRSDNFVTNLRMADEELRSNNKKNTYCRVAEGKLLVKKQGGRYAHIYPFGMDETAYGDDEQSLRRAKLINYLYDTANYEENKFQGLLVLNAMDSEQIWEEAERAWNGLSVALKWSNLYNAYTIGVKLASLRVMRGLAYDDTSRDTWTLSDEEAEMLARIEHNRWNVEKLLMGYRKPHRDEDKYENESYKDNLKKNKERFIHHDIRPFETLGPIKELDREFSRYIPWLLKMTE